MIFTIIAACVGLVTGGILMYMTTQRYGHRRQKMQSLTKYVVFSITVLIVYIIAEMIVSTVTGVAHPDLSTVVGSTFGGELLFCCVIRIFKLRSEDTPPDDTGV